MQRLFTVKNAFDWPRAALIALLFAATQWAAPAQADTAPLQVGSKRFTESYILGEILTQTAARFSATVHRQGLGNTAIVFGALQSGNIDLYPEYIGTIDSEILHHKTPTSIDQIRRELAPMGIGVGVSLGFNNGYALAMRGDGAGPKKLSELATQPRLRFGLSHEFLGRSDGWPGLARHYQLAQQPVGLDHGIAYEALAAGQVDVIDVYSTDAKIGKLKLQVLADDANFFPRYDAVLLYRLDVPQRYPSAWKAIENLAGTIDNQRMIALNAAVELDGHSFAAVAHQLLAPTEPPTAAENNGSSQQALSTSARESFLEKLIGPNFWRLTRQHSTLVVAAVLFASLFGIPLGIVAAYLPRLRRIVMGLVGVLQTVPSLALLAMLIPLLGRIGTLPALIALFVYALLPVVGNTCVGILQIPPGLRMAALALGLTRRDRLLYIELPLALAVILTGVKTAAVMSVGTATIAAFIGAGGYGERIAIGLALNDNQMLLAGALPAAAMALLVQWLFDRIEALAVRGTRHSAERL